jgi:hypothetical protein
MFSLDYLHASSIKCVAGKKLKKREEEKETEKVVILQK